MIVFVNREEPDFWKAYRKKYPKDRYDDLQKSPEGPEVRQKIRNYILQEQKYVCCYCCRRIEEKQAVNEHLKPRGVYPNKSMDFDNLVVSCNSAESCTQHKEDQYDEALFISPLEEDCEEHFFYSPTGETSSKTARGRYMIEVCGLNSYALKQARKATYKNCQFYQDPDDFREGMLEADADNRFQAHIDLIRYYYRQFVEKEDHSSLHDNPDKI